MSGIVKIVAPTNNVNDTSVVVYEFLVDNGAEVKERQDVIAIETSKATTKIETPTSGFIKFVVSIGDEIPNGGILAIVAEKAEQLNEYNAAEKKEIKTERESENNNIIKPTNSGAIPFGIFNKPITLGEIYIKNGEHVEKGSMLCKIRSENGIEPVIAPKNGYLHWNVETYKSLSAGKAIGTINSSPMINDDLLDMRYDSLRVSKEAQRILDERSLSAESLGLSGLVTSEMVKDRLSPSNKKLTIQSQGMPIHPVFFAHSTEGFYHKLSKTKQAEAKYLSDANGNTVVSQVSVLVPTKGIFTVGAEDPELSSRFSSIIVFETGRLLKSYRQMLSTYDDGQLFVYDHINIGYALAIDDGLKVPVFRDVDQKDVDTIISEKNKYIEKYVCHELTLADLEGGTFTITDLSSTGCYMFNPVLNLGQSVILGIGGENPERTNYPIILAFDHRVIDGATATEFLTRLRERLVAHENVLIGKKEDKGLTIEPKVVSNGEVQDIPVDFENLVCGSCYRSINELGEMGHYLLKVIDKTGKEKHICSICMRGW